MIVRIKDGRKVDVAHEDCPSRACFSVGMDKGVYSPGRGYVRYHEKPSFVCWWRHLYGCPILSRCWHCERNSPRFPGEACDRCGRTLDELDPEYVEQLRKSPYNRTIVGVDTFLRKFEKEPTPGG